MKNNQEFKKPLIFDIDISPFQQYPMTYKGVGQHKQIPSQGELYE